MFYVKLNCTNALKFISKKYFFNVKNLINYKNIL